MTDILAPKLPQTQQITPKYKRFKIRLSKELSENLSPSQKTETKRLLQYTVAKKLKPENEDSANFPLPGSLEQDLTDTPDSFFDIKPSLLPPVSKYYKTLVLDKINDSEENSRKQSRIGHNEAVDPTHVHMAVKRTETISSNSQYTIQQTNISPKKQKVLKRQEQTDGELKLRYDRLKSQLHYYGESTMPPVSLKINKGPIQEHCFNAYNTVQKVWQNTIKDNCQKLGRNFEQSLICRAENFRKKMEKSIANEINSPTGARHGAWNWFLSLRANPLIKDRRNCMMPIGNNYSGLWINIIDRPKNYVEYVHNHGNFTTLSTFNKPKKLNDPKRVSEFSQMTTEENLCELLVFLRFSNNYRLKVKMLLKLNIEDLSNANCQK